MHSSSSSPSGDSSTVVGFSDLSRYLSNVVGDCSASGAAHRGTTAMVSRTNSVGDVAVFDGYHLIGSYPTDVVYLIGEGTTSDVGTVSIDLDSMQEEDRSPKTTPNDGSVSGCHRGRVVGIADGIANLDADD